MIERTIDEYGDSPALDISTRDNRTFPERVSDSFRHKMRKPIRMENREKATQMMISVAGSARAGHGDFTGYARSVTINEVIEAYVLHEGKDPFGFIKGKIPRTRSSVEEVVGRAREFRQMHADAFMEHHYMVLDKAPAVVNYTMPGKKKGLFGFTYTDKYGENHPVFSSSFEQYVIGMHLATAMDDLNVRLEAQRDFPMTFAGEPFRIGGGESYLLDIPKLRQEGYSLSSLETNEDMLLPLTLKQKGVLNGHVKADKLNLEWQYVRRVLAPGTSDGLAFMVSSWLGGLGTGWAVMAGDNYDTWNKFMLDYSRGERDKEIMDAMQTSKKANRVIDKFHLDDLAKIFIIMSAKGFTTQPGNVLYSSTGMVPNHYDWQGHGFEQDWDMQESMGIDSKFDMPHKSTSVNLRYAGQRLPFVKGMYSDWKGTTAETIADEFRRRVGALQDNLYDLIPQGYSRPLLSWLTKSSANEFHHDGIKPRVTRMVLPIGDLARGYSGAYSR